MKKLLCFTIVTLAVAFASAQPGPVVQEGLNDDEQGQTQRGSGGGSETKIERLNDLDFDDRGQTGSAQGTDRPALTAGVSSAIAKAGISLRASTPPEIEYAAKNFSQGASTYNACYRAPNGRKKKIPFRYTTAAQKRNVKRWVNLYIDQALANPNSALGKRLNTLDADLARCQQVLDIDPNTGRSRRLDNYDKVLDIQPNGRSQRLDDHETRINAVERGQRGSSFGFGWLATWLLIVTVGLVWGLFLRPRGN